LRILNVLGLSLAKHKKRMTIHSNEKFKRTFNLLLFSMVFLFLNFNIDLHEVFLVI